MAVTWIKMRSNLHLDPRVIGIAMELDTTEAEVVGLCFILWSWADEVTEDGHIRRVSAPFIDRLVGRPGFADALVAAGWLTVATDGLELVNFEEHNGHSAKRRAQEANRKQTKRRKPSASDADKKRTESAAKADQIREEKRREEEEGKRHRDEPLDGDPDGPVSASERCAHQDGFGGFWNSIATVPVNRRTNRNSTRDEYIRAIRRGAAHTTLVERVVAYCQSDEGTTARFGRSIARWLREDGWDEDPTCWARPDRDQTSSTEAPAMQTTEELLERQRLLVEEMETKSK